VRAVRQDTALGYLAVRALQAQGLHEVQGTSKFSDLKENGRTLARWKKAATMLWMERRPKARKGK